MLIKVTNAHPDHLGNKLILNTDMILSFYEGTGEEDKHIVYAHNMQDKTWQISETIDQIMKMIKIKPKSLE